MFGLLASPIRAEGSTGAATRAVLPQLSVAGVSVTEGNSGTTSAVFTVVANATSSRPMSVGFATSDGTAVAPGDYVATTGTVTIPVGSTTATFAVSVVGDTLYEHDEAFKVTLSKPVNAALGTRSATGTILNDDAEPVVSVGAASVPEGNSGTTPMVFTVTLSAVSGFAVKVAFRTSDGTAKAPADYTATVGTVSIAAGSTSATFSVPVVGDLLYEGNETLTATLAKAVNAKLGTSVGAGTIVDDDAEPVVSIGAASVPEGNSGTTPLVFTASASALSGLPITLKYKTSDGSAKAPNDYIAKSGTVKIPAGSPSATFAVSVVGDAIHENNETFTVTFSNPVNATLGTATATGTIIDDDGPRARVGRRRVGDRGQQRHEPDGVHGQHQHGQRPAGDRGLRDLRRHGDGTRRLSGGSGIGHDPGRRDDRDIHRAGRRRPDARSERDIRCHALAADERGARNRNGHRHDPRRRRPADRFRGRRLGAGG